MTRVLFDAAHAVRRGELSCASTCLRTVSGHWLRVEATALAVDDADIAVVLQPAAVHQLLGALAACNKLTAREYEVLGLLAHGLAGKQIARVFNTPAIQPPMAPPGQDLTSWLTSVDIHNPLIRSRSAGARPVGKPRRSNACFGVRFCGRSPKIAGCIRISSRRLEAGSLPSGRPLLRAAAHPTTKTTSERYGSTNTTP